MSVISIANEAATLVLNGYVVRDLSEGDYLTLTPVNPHTVHANSTGNGVSIQKRLDGNVYDLAFTVQKFSPADVYFNNALNQAAPVVFNGSAKEAYNRDGNNALESWVLETGTLTTMPTHTKNNQDGNAKVTYTVRFRNAQRAL